MRPSIESARIASPAYSTTYPFAPAEVSCAISPRIRSFAPTPRPGRPSNTTRMRLRRFWTSVCVASTCSTSLVPMPNASAPNAPCVEVCESPHTIVIPGCVSPSSGPITCTIPWRACPRP